MPVAGHRDADLLAHDLLPVETEARGDSRQIGIEGCLLENEEDAEGEQREGEEPANDPSDIGNLEQQHQDQRRADGVDRKLGPGQVGGEDRKSVVSGKRVSVRVDLGGRSTIKKQKKKTTKKIINNYT